MSDNIFIRSSLEALSGRENPSFTMSITPARKSSCETCYDRELGGARRDRTDDLMLAKHALYQLSYGPYFARLAPRFEGQALCRELPSRIWVNCRTVLRSLGEGEW